METLAGGILASCWLGILTSISPCPLATNIAAVTYIGRRVDHPAKVLAAGLLYTLGRMVTYVVVAALVVAGALSVPGVARFLQSNMNKLLGPLLVIAGLILLGVIRFRMPALMPDRGVQQRVDRWGVWGAGPLGLLFALSFCPVSAALFFGSLVPLAMKHESAILFPSAYGIGTALPVVGCALVIAFGARFLGQVFNRLSVFERWARGVTGVAFLLVGSYYCLLYLFGVDL